MIQCKYYSNYWNHIYYNTFKLIPGKVMKKIKNEPLIGLLLKRLKLSKKITNIVVATSNNKNNIPLIEYLKDNKYLFFLVI